MQGVTVFDEENTFRGRSGFSFDVEGLPVGRYRATARSPAGLVCGEEFTIVDLREPIGEIELVLR